MDEEDLSPQLSAPGRVASVCFLQSSSSPLIKINLMLHVAPTQVAHRAGSCPKASPNGCEVSISF